jgi:predicted enzyme related to lactoylglutathione lyase
MSRQNEPVGIGWIDVTVDDAESVRDFYGEVAGWRPEDVSMGEYDDFYMTLPGSGKPAAGICRARGSNAELPPQSLIYITVDNVDASAETCHALGGTVLVGPRAVGGGRFSVIENPAGAVAALSQAP